MNRVRLLAVALLAPCAASGLASDGLALMRESDRRLRADNEFARYTMDMLEGGKLVHTRELVRLEKREAGRSLSFVRFTAPASVRNVSLLIEDKGQAYNDIWSYTPATKSLRRVAGSQKQNWFMGTEFSYEDFEGYKLAAYAFTRLEPSVPCLQWTRCEVVEATPTATDEVRASGYVKKRYHLEAASLYPVLVEYFDRNGLVKRLETEELRRHGAYARPAVQVMSSLATRRATRLVTQEVDLVKVLDPNIFTLKYLRFEGH